MAPTTNNNHNEDPNSLLGEAMYLIARAEKQAKWIDGQSNVLSICSEEKTSDEISALTQSFASEDSRPLELFASWHSQPLEIVYEEDIVGSETEDEKEEFVDARQEEKEEIVEPTREEREEMVEPKQEEIVETMKTRQEGKKQVVVNSINSGTSEESVYARLCRQVDELQEQVKSQEHKIETLEKKVSNNTWAFAQMLHNTDFTKDIKVHKEMAACLHLEKESIAYELVPPSQSYSITVAPSMEAHNFEAVIEHLFQ